MANLADEIKNDALEAVKFSRKHLVTELDYSAESIADLEDNVDSVEYAVSGGKSADNIELLTKLWGAYLGESLRRKCGGEWVRDDDGRVGLRGASATVFPHEQVRRRLTDGPEHSLPQYFEQAAAEL